MMLAMAPTRVAAIANLGFPSARMTGFIDCAAEYGNDLILKNQIDHSQYQTAYDAENYSVSNAFLAEAVSPLPRQMLTNAQQPSPIITAIARATTVNGNTTVFAALP